MVGQEWHRQDQTDLRELLHVLHAPRAELYCAGPTECWLFYQSLCRGSNWWDTAEKPNEQTEHQRESVGRAGWRCRKWKPCDQQPCPLPLANWSPAPVLHNGNTAQRSAPETLNHLHIRHAQGKDSCSGLRKLPEQAVWLSLPRDFRFHQPERGEFEFDLYWLNSDSNFCIIFNRDSNCILLSLFQIKM